MILRSRLFCKSPRVWTAVWVLSSTSLHSNKQRRFGFEMTAALSSNSQCSADSTRPSVYRDVLSLHPLNAAVPSTQEECVRLLNQQYKRKESAEEVGAQPLPYLVVWTDEQTKGRGTKGRSWEGQSGNLYWTCGVPMNRIPVTLTLFPLKLGVLVANLVSQVLQEHGCMADESATSSDTPRVSVKWPNDVLIDQDKLAGILIESALVPNEYARSTADTTMTYLIVGIGINVAFAPSLQGTPGKHGRKATCLQDHCPVLVDAKTDKSTLVDTLAVRLAQQLVDWLESAANDSPADARMQKSLRDQQVVQQWKDWTRFGQVYELRGDVQQETIGKHVGEQVVAVDLEYDGQLRVRGQDGRERLLVADYLF
jgi:BirA family transcriptional regulator, biotin operon repressor / biotin---[acetyl-CoA-carboxylase] ligase